MTPEQAIDVAERAVNAVHTRLVPTAAAADDRSERRRAGRLRPRRPGARSSGASGPAGCSPTTTC